MAALESPSARRARTSRSRGDREDRGPLRRRTSRLMTWEPRTVPPTATRRSAAMKSSTSSNPIREQVAGAAAERYRAPSPCASRAAGQSPLLLAGASLVMLAIAIIIRTARHAAR